MGLKPPAEQHFALCSMHLHTATASSCTTIKCILSNRRMPLYTSFFPARACDNLEGVLTVFLVPLCSVSPEMLMRTASSYTSPAIHAVTRSLLRMIMANASLPDAVGSNGPQASMAAPMTSMSSYTALSSRMGSSMPSSLRLGGHLVSLAA